MHCRLLRSDGLNPYFNQAIEAALLDMADDETHTLYLWQNDKTVFIGKNQNAFTECRVPVIEADGGFIARRISGGGSVYHDKGNLNFTFISTAGNFDIGRNFEIMVSAMRNLGINAELSGRNDMTVGGRKFSGNAFYRGEKCFHHGTVLIDVNGDMMNRYLSVPKAKLEAKGVKSVISRVINLRMLNPDIDADKVADSIAEAFGSFYGEPIEQMSTSDIDDKLLAGHCARFSDPNWIMGDNIGYGAQISARFSWGTADIRLKLNGSVVEKARIYSDSLDPKAVEKKELALVGADIYKGKEQVNDILQLFKEQNNGF